MNVDELGRIAKWLKKNGSAAQSKYEAVRAILQHNSQQADKQPLESPLEDLISFLKSMRLHVLSNEQLKMLDTFKTAEYFGDRGISFVESSIKKSDFDPATATTEFQQAIENIQNAINRADQILSAFKGVDLHTDGITLDEGRALVRVEFRNDASINNVVDWKEWSERWLEIARGIAVAIDEAPEDVHVVGATRGSIIVELAGTLFFVSVLTAMAAKIIGVSIQFTQLQQHREQLRTQRLVNDAMEAAMKEKSDEIIDKGIDTVFEAVKPMLPKRKVPDGDRDNGLKRAIGKLIDFHTSGGEVDFVAPEEQPVDDGQEPGANAAQIAELRNNIEDMRKNRDEFRRLSFNSEDGEEEA